MDKEINRLSGLQFQLYNLLNLHESAHMHTPVTHFPSCKCIQYPMNWLWHVMKI